MAAWAAEVATDLDVDRDAEEVHVGD